MAASVSQTQRKEEFQEEFLTCSICAEPYDNDTHQAKCLPCLHTYCKCCLQTHAGQRPKFNCPKCRCLVTIPGGTVENLQNNFLVENLKEYRDIFSVAISCGSCDEGNRAAGFCQNCGCFLCKKCMDAHERLGLRLQHKISTLAELQHNKCNPTIQENQCKKHSKQDMVLFCKEVDCQIPLCAVCGLVEHRGHELIDFTAAVDEVVADIQQSSAMVNSRNMELAQKRSGTEALQKTLGENFIIKKKAIQESEQQLIRLITAQSSKALNHLDDLYQTQMDFLMSNLESIDTYAVQMSSACEYAKQVCETNNPTLILAAQNQIMPRFYELTNTHIPEVKCEKTDFAFTDNHHSATANIQHSLQSFCDIRWSDQTIYPEPDYDYGQIGVPITQTIQNMKHMNRDRYPSQRSDQSSANRPDYDYSQIGEPRGNMQPIQRVASRNRAQGNRDGDRCPPPPSTTRGNRDRAQPLQRSGISRDRSDFIRGRQRSDRR